MTAAPISTDDLGLNLVFETDPAPLAAAAAAGVTKKRKNKYDRRREKGRLAKLAKESSGKSTVGASSLRAKDKSLLSSRSDPAMVEAVQKKDGNGANLQAEAAPAAGTSKSAAPKSGNASDSSGTMKDSGKNETETAAATQHTKVDTKTRVVEPKSFTVNTSVANNAAAANQTKSSRRNRTQSTFSEEEERARYLSEFHARPRDLDRNERASREIKASVASDHIFGVDDGFEGGSLDGNEKDKRSGQTTNCPFRRLGLDPNITKALTNPDGHFRLSQPTIVQSRAINALLPLNGGKMTGKGAKKLEENLFVQSETGSGKTLAYLLPILQHLAVDLRTQAHKRVDRQLGGTRAILLMPTRELCTQTYTIANHLCSKSFPWIVAGCFSGGEKRKSEKARLRKGITILIATPGRLLDHLCKTESLLVALKGKLEWFVLDEADRLLDAGLGGQVEQIVQHLRSNQPRAGANRDGVTWRSVLVSATVTKSIEGLAKTVLGGNGWQWATGHNEKKQEMQNESSEKVDDKMVHSAPRQLAQLYMVVNAKLRLSTLVAFLAARASKGERTVVFMSTCDGVDYHHALFNSMTSIFANEDAENREDGGGIFGNTCPVYKLHGDIPHAKRLETLNQFTGKGCTKNSAILLATDVAARGLNLPSLDWIVQYDPPCETNDYIHRAGRSARAGQSGHSLLFLLPSERQYVEVLQLRGLDDITALSLSATLTSAAGLCTALTQEGETKSSGNTFSDGKGEAFTAAIQNRLEQCVIQDDADYKASIEKKVKDAKQRRKLKKDAAGPLLLGARRAFSAFVRAYPAKEKAVRHIFNARGLHLGHIARSLALKETPKMVSRVNSNTAVEADDDNKRAQGEKRKSRLAFNAMSREESQEVVKMQSLADEEDREEKEAKAKSYSGATKKRMKVSGENQKGVQQRMMEQARLLQSQGMEFM